MPRELFVAYFRVGTGRQGRSELGLDAQHRAVADYLDAGARELVGEYTEVESGQRCDRPELARALDACRRQQATLIIARLDRLARNASALFPIFERMVDCEVVFCDPPQATAGRPRKFLTTQMADADEIEEDLAGQRRRAAWGTTREPGKGVGWAEPAFDDHRQPARRTDMVARRLADQRAVKTLPIVRELQESGIGTLQGMADALNARGIPTARGARWYPTTVKNLLGRDVQGSQQVAA
jgi:DNA invertase Pin-like site-specific DNA recombinase